MPEPLKLKNVRHKKTHLNQFVQNKMTTIAEALEESKGTKENHIRPSLMAMRAKLSLNSPKVNMNTVVILPEQKKTPDSTKSRRKQRHMVILPSQNSLELRSSIIKAIMDP